MKLSGFIMKVLVRFSSSHCDDVTWEFFLDMDTVSCFMLNRKGRCTHYESNADRQAMVHWKCTKNNP